MKETEWTALLKYIYKKVYIVNSLDEQIFVFLSLCRYDYVEVRDGVDESGQLVGKYCGKIAPSPVVSSGNQLFIKFVSDYETHGAGFSIRYEIFKTGE